MVRAVLFLGKKNPDAEIVVNFDDSIVEDVDAEAKRAMLERRPGSLTRSCTTSGFISSRRRPLNG